MSSWLMVRGGALGDFVLSTPVLRALSARADHLTLCCTPRYAGPWAGLAQEILDIRGLDTLWLHGSGRPPRSFDAAYVTTPGVAPILRGLGIPLVLEAPPRPPPGSHAADALWRPLRSLTQVQAPPDPRVSPVPEALAHIEGLLGGARPVLLVPGAASPSKVWGGFVGLAELLVEGGRTPCWVPGRDEPPLGRVPGVVLPTLDLPQLVALASRARAWVGNDTGTSHLAAATGCATFAFFGPTKPEQWCPRGASWLPMELDPLAALERISQVC